MNKQELIDVISEQTDVPKAQVGKILDSTLHTIQEAAAKGEIVQLIDFGSFAVKERAARTGRNPKTGEEITISAARVPSFTPGKSFKDRVNS